MSEQDPKNPPAPNGDKNNGGDKTPKNDPNENGNMIPQSRLNEEIDKRKDAEARLKKLEDDAAEKARKDAEKNNEFQKLYETEKAQREAESKKAREALLRAAFISKANGKNIVNLDDAYTLALGKLSDLKVDDNGNVDGIDTVIDQLVKDKPYLVSGKSSAPVGNPTNPAPAGGQAEKGTRTYTKEEIANMSQAEFEKNKPDINRAMTEGRIK